MGTGATRGTEPAITTIIVIRVTKSITMRISTMMVMVMVVMMTILGITTVITIMTTLGGPFDLVSRVSKVGYGAL